MQTFLLWKKSWNYYFLLKYRYFNGKIIALIWPKQGLLCKIYERFANLKCVGYGLGLFYVSKLNLLWIIRCKKRWCRWIFWPPIKLYQKNIGVSSKFSFFSILLHFHKISSTKNYVYKQYTLTFQLSLYLIHSLTCYF